jgi:hypothetical protein
MRLLQSLQRTRNDLRHGRGLRSRRSRSHLACEPLETRAMLSGYWTPLLNTVPSKDGAQSMVLLTNGSVLVHGGSGNASSAYYELTPECHEDSQKPFMGNFLRSSARGMVMR